MDFSVCKLNYATRHGFELQPMHDKTNVHHVKLLRQSAVFDCDDDDDDDN